MEDPAVVILNGHPAMASGMSKERHEEHSGRERQANRFKSKPLSIGVFVQDP